MTIQDNILTADEGKWLTNGQTYSQQVWLGINDSPSNWHEVDESEVPEDYKQSSWEEQHKEEEE
jgi:hypothetical protein